MIKSGCSKIGASRHARRKYGTRSVFVIMRGFVLIDVREKKRGKIDKKGKRRKKKEINKIEKRGDREKSRDGEEEEDNLLSSR